MPDTSSVTYFRAALPLMSLSSFSRPALHFSYVINYPDGKKERVRQSLNTSSKGIAEKIYRSFLNSIEDGSYFKKAVEIPRMKEVIERYMKEVSPLQKSHDRNKEIYLHWINYCGDLLASEVTTSLLSSYKAKRLTGDLRFGKSKDPDKRRKAGQSTIKKELAFLRMIFNKAYR